MAGLVEESTVLAECMVVPSVNQSNSRVIRRHKNLVRVRGINLDGSDSTLLVTPRDGLDSNEGDVRQLKYTLHSVIVNLGNRASKRKKTLIVTLCEIR